MVFCGGWLVKVARTSANCCQYIACNPERLSSEQILHLLCCLPLHYLRRLVLCVFSFLCFPLPAADDHRRRYRIYYLYQSSSSSSSSSDLSDEDSHSD